MTPVPGASSSVVVGAFLYRGEAVTTLDLFRLWGPPRELDLEARVVVLQSVRPVAVVVDQLLGIVDAPRLLGRTSSSVTPAGVSADWNVVPLVADWCELEGRAIPLVAPESLLRLAEGAR
jgi:hypothetical protein